MVKAEDKKANVALSGAKLARNGVLIAWTEDGEIRVAPNLTDRDRKAIMDFADGCGLPISIYFWA